MAYALANVVSQWEEGERRVGDERALDPAVAAVVEELRRRLGSRFEIGELAELYAGDTDWAEDLARARSAGAEAGFAVAAAFGRYARQAADYSGGRVRRRG